MKQIFISLLLFISLTSTGQTIMNVYKSNGSVVQIPSSSIDSVNFSSSVPPPMMNIYQINGVVTSIPISSIDSITYNGNNLGNLATISTAAVTGITSVSVTSGGDITNDGGSSIILRGVCWSTSHNPLTSNSKTANGGGVGSFISNITGLAINTTYYLRAYAINSKGTVYGNEISFTTTGLFVAGNGVTDTDGHFYPSVILGTQEWTSQNLRTTRYANGDTILNITNALNWQNASKGAWSWFNNNSQYDVPFGKLYNFYAMSDSRNACPSGWHVPASAEWSTLVSYLSDSLAGRKMKTTDTIYWKSPNNGTNESGFSGVGGGYILNDGSYRNMGDYGLYWSNSVSCSDNFFAWMLGLENNKLGVDFNGLNDKHFGYSARCVKGAPLVFTTSVITTDSVRNVTDHSMAASGTVISDGSYPVYQRGICYSPDYASNTIFSSPHTIDSTVGSASFTNYITDLSPGVNYRAQAYSVTCAGVSYGSSILFSTPSLPPGLSTNAVYAITTTSALSGGVFISGGGSSIVAKGVCWSTTPLPTISNSKTNDGTGLVNFTSTVTNLLPNTKYYIRAYATNAGGTGYGNQDTFTTYPALPAVTTASMSSIAGTTATAGGNVTYNGGATVTQRGVCWDTASNPTIGNNKTIDGTGNGTFTSNLTGLSYGTKYYLRAYATNIAGTVYGNEDTFTTTTFFTVGGGVTDIDGNAYTSVNIGSQEWTVQNLRTTKYANGDPIPNVTDTTWGNLSTGAWKWYDNNSQYEIPYGKLYNAYAVCDPRNACPTGWHVPADAEWNSLIKLLDNVADTNISIGVQSQNAANKLKEIGNSHWIDLGGTNESGFTAVPGGTTRYHSLGNLAYWWSSTERNNKSGYSHWINDIIAPSQGERRDTSYKYDGLSVRCVKGAVVLPSPPIVSTTSITNITGTSASTGGTVTSGGGGPVTARGVCFSTSPNPTLSNKKTIDGTGTGSYTSSLGALLVNTTYYVRAYATNVAGTAYGNEVSFTTTSQLYTNGGGVTDLDGNTYTSVIVGTQEWMAQNLKTTKYANGDPIPNVTDSAQWRGLSSGAWCYLSNDTSYNTPYGKLYNWYTVSDARNVCPTGWRVPSKSDWNKFVILLDPTADTTINVQTSNGGDKMKEAGTSHWLSAGGTNESGFTALSFGNRTNTGAFQFPSSLSVTQWWSSKPNTSTKAFSWGVWNLNTMILESPTDKVTGFSIRCIK